MNENTYVSNPGIWSIVKGFYTARSKFNSFYEMYKNDQTVDFQKFYNLVKEDMAPLEERAHELIRPDDSIQRLMEKHSGKVRNIDLEKDLFDIILGELLHETEDLKAAIHQANDYKPRLMHHRREEIYGIRNAALTFIMGHMHRVTSWISSKYPSVKKLFDRAILKASYITEHKTLRLMMRYVNRAEKRIPRKYEEVKKLFDDATKILEEHLLPIYKEDMHLLKSMILNQDSDYFKENGDSRVQNIFRYMFKDGAFEAYYVAGISWEKTGHIGDAINNFRKALDVYENRGDDKQLLQRNRQKLIDMIALIPKEDNEKLLERIQNLAT